MKRTAIRGVLVGSAAMLLTMGCRPSLDVTNPNNPDVARALASPEDVQNLAVSSMNSWYLGATDIEPYLMMSVTADASTANFGNFGMRFNNLEPRIAYANNSAGGDRGVAASPWDNSYQALGAANDVLRALAGGLSLGSPEQTKKYKHLAMFVQAAEFTNLALIFDQAFPVDENRKEGEAPALAPYKDISALAVTKWAALIGDLAGSNDTYDQTSEFPMSGAPLSSSRIARIANTMAALTLGYTPRNAADAAKVDWAKVAAFADKGIGTGSAGAPFDFEVTGDNNLWYSYIQFYGDEPSWMRVDMRVIHLMDPNSPSKFDGNMPPKGSSADARFDSDYFYHGKVIGDPARGIYMQSPYSHQRYSFYRRTSSTSAEGPVPYLLAAESDLMRAEALIRSSGDLVTAASLINITRVGRGKLPPATAVDGAAQLLKDIEYERDVELINSSGMTLFQRRHVDGLQPGTIHHLPIPAKELETLGLPIYTFGGVGKEESLIGFTNAVLSRESLVPASSQMLELPNGRIMTLRTLPTPPRPGRGLFQ